MLPDLVKFHDEHADKMTIRNVNLTKHRGGEGDFPVSAIPTQFFFNADGTPYRPKQFAIGGSFELIVDDAGNHILTKRVGSLSFDEMVLILDDLTAQQ
jgi:hypothetical protein